MYRIKTTTSLFLLALTYSNSFSNSLCEQENIKNLNSHIASKCADFTETCVIDEPVAIYSNAADQLPEPLPPIEIKENGALCVTNDTLKDSIEISAQSFFINNGLMQLGSASSPLKNKITIKMTGKKSAAPAPKPLCKDTDSGIIECSTIAEDSANTPNGRDITVMGSGKLKLYGAKGLTKNRDTSEFYVDHKPTKNQTTAGDDTYIQLNRDEYFNNIYGNQSWTFLSQPAGPGYYDSEHAWVSSPVSYSSIDVYVDGETKPLTIDPANYANYLMLSKNIDKDPDTTWQPGDWISISTTSFSSHQTEIVQICKIHQVDNPERFSAKPPPIKLNYTLPDTVSLIQLADGTTTCDNGETLAATPLKHYHFGSLAPTPGIFDASDNGKDFTNSDDQTFQPKVGQSYRMYDGAERNYGIDERAEVALLSRNIKFTSDARPGGDGFDHLQPQFFGGHIAVMNHDGMPNPEVEVELVGVELEKFGQAMVGRYPVHLHRLNKDGGSVADPNQLLIQDVSVHHSFNKCFVVHETKSAKLHNNVCVRTVGQGIYLEDGSNVSGNTFIRNLIVGTMSAAIPYIHFKPSNNDEENYILSPDTGKKTGYNQFWDGDYLVMNNVIKYDANNVPDTSNSGANTGHPLDQLEPNGFWITNLNNIFVNNSVAGCQFQGRGYWVVNQSATANSFPAQNAYPVFSSNRAHGCFGGLDTDSRMTAGINGSFTNNPKPTAPKIQITAQGTDQPPVAIFNSLDITRMRYKGVWTRTLFSNIADSYFAALKQGVTVLGGGGPEGNIFGFWSMVQDSVFAGITRNNVDRYFDCENYAQTIASFDDEKILTSAYEVNGYNEASECTSLPKMVAVTKNGKTTNEHIFSLAGDQSATNFNLQGYTFYDGPARLENNRFINFRADATDRHSLKSDNLPDNYPLVGANKVDVLKMRDYRNTSQISNKSYGGGTHYYGYDGDAAMSWLKANAQAVPPSQYSLGNLWQNTDFKHQVFTELSNLSNELHDGDKSTIIIDKDGSLSGFRSCDAQGKCNIGTETLAHHFPISLNNLDIYATAYSLDEPDSSGRNNVRPSSLISPHQYAGINIEGVNFEAGDNGHPKIKIIRDMSVYGKSELPYETLTGRGGQGIYELFFMNHMGYTIANDDKKTFSTNLLLSYSDAPIEHLFANRISICVGKGLDVDKIKINKTLRQWGTTQNYNTQRSTYLEDDSVVKNQKNCDTLYNSPNKAEQWQACFDNKTLSLTKTNDLNTINKELVDVISDNSQPNATQSYYYNAENGMLYFNMIQAGNVKPNKITTPYVSCDVEIYESALEAIKQTKDYTDPALVERALSIACLVKDNQPQPEELLACPDEGCATYALNITNAGSPQPSPCDVNNISQAQIVPPILEDGKLPLGLPLFNESTGQINYQSEYYLASMNNLSQLPIKSGSVLVADKPYYYHCSSNVSYPQTGYLPLAEILCTEDNLIDYTGNPGFSATSFGSDTPEPGPGPGPTPTDGVKWMLNMGPNVAMSLSIDDGQSVLISNGSDKSTITVESGSEAGKNEIFYVDKDVFSAGVAATLKYGPPATADKYSCQITMNDKGANQTGGTCNECGLAPPSATSTSITFGANCQ